MDGNSDIVLEQPSCVDGTLGRLCGETRLLRDMSNDVRAQFILHPTPVFPDARMYHAQFATDVDADGDLDFIVMNLDGGLHLLRNDLETEHHSLGFSFTNDWAGASMRCLSQTEPSITR